jgi:hypothetical protein
LANVLEQGLKIGGQRIAGPMQVADHLIEIISKTHQLPIIEPGQVAPHVTLRYELAAWPEQDRTSEVNRPHADRLSALANAFKFIGGEAQVELLAPWF